MVLRTVTVQGVAVPNVAVTLARHAPCDPATRDLPEGSAEVGQWSGTTDAEGKISFAVPVGCFHFGMKPPPGTNPVPEGMHTLFLATGGQSVTGSLRFQDPAPTTECDPQTIENDLGLGEPHSSAVATVRECDGSWAVIAWDLPGDSQRLVRRVDSHWTTYVIFPHDRCWAAAQADGVPSTLKQYFSTC
ncbi:hypothetical protein [Nocardia sp. NBC_01377]|uniref:hypothetical protein n=1 Tax=Nocardia sp. NBC_01377 TaxID=2903595 RepID=UPI003868E0E2